MQTQTPPTTWHNDAPLAARTYSTDELAAAFKVKPHTVRQSYCNKGHYAGIRPVKLPNRFLAWPADAVDRVLSGEVAA